MYLCLKDTAEKIIIKKRNNMKQSIQTSILGIIIIFIIVFGMTACDNDPITLDCPAINVGEYEANTGDAYWVVNAQIIANCLVATLSVSGGCAEHDFEIYTPGTVLESLPMGAPLTLWHEDNDDPCDGIFEQMMSFDLTPLQVPSDSVIIIHLSGWDDNLFYQY